MVGKREEEPEFHPLRVGYTLWVTMFLHGFCLWVGAEVMVAAVQGRVAYPSGEEEDHPFDHHVLLYAF